VRVIRFDKVQSSKTKSILTNSMLILRSDTIMQQYTNLRNRKRSGFTLIEIMVVLVIIGVMAALIVPRVVGRAI
jgi:general secretion pathway protein G